MDRSFIRLNIQSVWTGARAYGVLVWKKTALNLSLTLCFTNLRLWFIFPLKFSEELWRKLVVKYACRRLRTIVWIDVCCEWSLFQSDLAHFLAGNSCFWSKSSFFLHHFYRWSEIRWAHSATRDHRHLENFFVKKREYVYISHKMRDVKGYLSRKQSEGGPLASDWVSLGELYEKRWGLFDFLPGWWTQLIHWDCLVMSAC